MSEPIVNVESELLSITGAATSREALDLVARLMEPMHQAEASLTAEELRCARALNLDPRAVVEFKATRKSK
ncbi:MAG: hypothetical protein QM765_07745 [Myxococcales bacterium]